MRAHLNTPQTSGGEHEVKEVKEIVNSRPVIKAFEGSEKTLLNTPDKKHDSVARALDFDASEVMNLNLSNEGESPNHPNEYEDSYKPISFAPDSRQRLPTEQIEDLKADFVSNYSSLEVDGQRSVLTHLKGVMRESYLAVNRQLFNES